MRPRTYPVYIKDTYNFQESQLARQTNSDFIKQIFEEKKDLINNTLNMNSNNNNTTSLSINTTNTSNSNTKELETFPDFKPPKYTGDKKKYFSESSQAQLLKELDISGGSSNKTGAFSTTKKKSFFRNLFGGSSESEDKKKNSTTNIRNSINSLSHINVPNLGENIYFSNKGVITSGIFSDKNNPYSYNPNPFILNNNTNNYKYTVIEHNTENKPMNVPNFLNQYFSQEDLDKLELSHMTDIDYEKLEELKEKSIEFIDATSHIANHDEDETSVSLAVFFNEKLNELKENEINMQIFIQNLDKVSGISYEKNGCRIYFKS